jgi:hypothetical protein
MSQQSVRQAARRSALDAQAIRRKERADRERWHRITDAALSFDAVLATEADAQARPPAMRTTPRASPPSDQKRAIIHRQARISPSQ